MKTWVGAVAGIAIATFAHGQTTTRVSVASDGSEANDFSGYYGLSISGDGRYVAFVSGASNLVPGGSPNVWHVYVHDRVSGSVRRASIATNGAPAEAGTERTINATPAISANGRYVAFGSRATNLDGYPSQVYVHDLQTGATTRITHNFSGGPANASCGGPAISANGRFVAFLSDATDLVEGPVFTSVAYVVDRSTGVISRIVADVSGGPPDGSTSFAAISANGRFVAFKSYANDLVADDRNGVYDLFVHDREIGVTSLVAVTPSGAYARNGAHGCPSLSADGRYIAFTSFSRDLLPGSGRIGDLIFVRDQVAATTTLVSVDSTGAAAHGPCYHPKLSADGRFVAFESDVPDLVANDTNHARDVFLHDRQTGETVRVSVDSNGAEGDQASGSPQFDSATQFDDHPYDLALSDDGLVVAFPSLATNLVAGDGNRTIDVFVHERIAVGVASVVPASGSEDGGDVVTIDGFGFADAAGTAVDFGGATATVLGSDSHRVVVRTPPGTGRADVRVATAIGEGRLAGGYAYLPREIAARFGSVNVGRGDRENVLLVNAVAGSPETREMTIGVGQPIVAVLLAPSSRSSARFAAYVWARSPGAATVRRLPRDVGSMAFPPPFLGGSPPGIWNNLGYPRTLGRATFPSRPAPSVLFRSQGLPSAVVVTMQGLIEDDASASGSGFSVTNAVVLRIE